MKLKDKIMYWLYLWSGTHIKNMFKNTSQVWLSAKTGIHRSDINKALNADRIIRTLIKKELL